MAQWFSRVSFADTLSSCLARTFPRDPLRSSRRLKMSYRLTAVYLSAGGHHGFVAELPRIRERIPRGRNVAPTLSTPPCQTRSTPRSRSRARAFRSSKKEIIYWSLDLKTSKQYGPFFPPTADEGCFVRRTSVKSIVRGATRLLTKFHLTWRI